MKSIKICALLLLALPLVMISCKQKQAKDAATVKFKLTDAPADFDALYIDVQSIQVQTAASGWVTLQSQVGTINLLQYVNGQSTLIAQAELPQGQINQVRLVLGSNNSIVANGQTYPIAIPAGMESGLVLNVHQQLQAGQTYEWTIDFDAAQSVMTTGSGSFHLEPVLRLIVDAQSSAGATTNADGTISIGGSTGGTAGGSVVINGDVTGAMSGSIAPVGFASVCITGSNGATYCTVTDLTGHFTLQTVAAGSYTVQIDPSLPLLSIKTISNVSVTAHQTTNLGVVAL